MRGQQLHAAVLRILEKHGSRTLAASSIGQAMRALGLKQDTLTPDDLEPLLERTMEGFRLFCSPEDRQAIWGELVALIESFDPQRPGPE